MLNGGKKLSVNGHPWIKNLLFPWMTRLSAALSHRISLKENVFP